MNTRILAIVLPVLFVAVPVGAQPDASAPAEEAVSEETSAEEVGAEGVAAGEVAAEPAVEEPAVEEAAPEPEYEPASEPAIETASSGSAALATGFGVGLGTTLGNTSGLLASFFFTPELGVQVGLGGQFFTVDGDNGSGNSVDARSLGLGLGAYCIYRLLALGDVSFNLLAGFEAVYLDFKQETTSEMPPADPVVTTSEGASVDLVGAAGFQAEWFVTDDLSLFAHTGVSFTYLGAVGVAARLGGQPSEAIDASGLDLRVGPTHVATMFGFTWWL